MIISKFLIAIMLMLMFTYVSRKHDICLCTLSLSYSHYQLAYIYFHLASHLFWLINYKNSMTEILAVINKSTNTMKILYVFCSFVNIYNNVIYHCIHMARVRSDPGQIIVNCAFTFLLYIATCSLSQTKA